MINFILYFVINGVLFILVLLFVLLVASFAVQAIGTGWFYAKGEPERAKEFWDSCREEPERPETSSAGYFPKVAERYRMDDILAEGLDVSSWYSYIVESESENTGTVTVRGLKPFPTDEWNHPGETVKITLVFSPGFAEEALRVAMKVFREGQGSLDLGSDLEADITISGGWYQSPLQ